MRRKAVQTIRNVRCQPPKPPRVRVLKNVRRYKIPPLQWDAGHWWDIIQWESTAVHQPEIIRRMTDDELEQALDNPVQFPAFPCHTQSVERAVKMVSTVTTQVEGLEARHGQILSVLASRRCRKDFASKKDYEFKTEELH